MKFITGIIAFVLSFSTFALEIKDPKTSTPYRSIEEAIIKLPNNQIDFFIVKNGGKEAYFAVYGCNSEYSTIISGPDTDYPPTEIIEELGKHACELLESR